MAYLLQHLLSESAARYPDNEALRFEGQALSYGELDKLTNQVTHALRAEGVQRGDRVGIFVRKSPASIVSIFAILKAGAIYVPMDPSAPAKRLAYMTQNCDISVVLVSAEKTESLPEIFAEETTIKTLICLDDVSAEAMPQLPKDVKFVTWRRVLQYDEANVPDPGTIETDLAYLLYTSGSTGVPKGVMISHRTIFTFINWCYATFNVTPDDRVTSHAPLHFDLSTFDIFVSIKAGATIILLPETLSVFPTQLAQVLQNERVTLTYLVPSLLSLLVNYGRLDSYDLSNIRTILFAGEVFPIKYLRKLINALPHADYYNLYGPTETNVCTYYKVNHDDIAPDKTQPVSIGQACENTEVFAVGDDGSVITEPGIEGELWVRGSCVAQGYWGDPEKTARTFISNHFQTHYNEVVYRTGDIVYLNEDAINWTFVGRRDSMIKVGGYRIEIGEIESVIYSHPAILEAAVIAVPDDLLGNRIKAYIVLKEEGSLSQGDLADYCSRSLPRYMAPKSFEFRISLPKTSTGKFNRTLLAGEN